ncbi:probable RRP45 - Exosome complex exonuclease [Melanopsichium pennsylvanicum]|uniref:Probable RRP45 - Exosome complex exonuclease n=2 Tax=Melanopsichium pennsylvanicum TaxID=63383 RepID=A0AAJ4XH30_9BASI|nr:probable RRP45-Exosome complex exonuclease [Melanopsichium pennsylvanicum 4]SNX82355.1 probable RRP45 - Exosome complex exonuclease [Melanopsichium pennsylvanicum]
MTPGQALEPSLTESDFTLSCLANGIRPDGRSFLTPRPISISFGEELGNVTVTIKGTRVSTSVRANLIPPRSDRPYEGFLQITTDISPMAGVEYDTTGGGANSSARAKEVLFDRLIEKAVRRTEAVDREALCVVAGEQVWNVHLTVHLLADTGAALDAAVLASMLSLRHFRRPDYSIENGNQVRLYSVHERVPVPLAIHHTPLCVTFALFNQPTSTNSSNSSSNNADAGDDHLIENTDSTASTLSNSSPSSATTAVTLLDPTLLEESLANSKLTLVLNAQREICVLDKSYGSPIQPQILLDLINVGLKRITELTQHLEEALTKDAQTRVVEVI